MAIDVSRPGEFAYAGVGTFAKLPLALTPDQLAGVDVAIMGAPFDEGVANRPGARFGPRAIRNADYAPGSPPVRPHVVLGVDPFERLRVVDYGDAECVAADLARSHAEVERRMGEILAAGAIPIVLGGDHSVAHPTMTALARHHGAGRVGVIQFDTHTDTAADLLGVVRSHGTPMRRVVQEGSIDGAHFVQVGLRGYWPGEAEWSWMRERGMRWHTANDVFERGIQAVIADVLEQARGFPDAVWLSVDVDVLEPAFAPGTGTPEPGGLLPRELLWALRRLASELPIAGMEVVEVSPPFDHADVTAMAAHRCVMEVLSGIALRRARAEGAA